MSAIAPNDRVRPGVNMARIVLSYLVDNLCFSSEEAGVLCGTRLPVAVEKRRKEKRKENR